MRARWKSFELPTRVIPESTTLQRTYGKFVAEPFEGGFGHTLGNSLRRILLSYIGGAAPYYVRIKGIAHEFSSVPGVVEDVEDIVLSVKRLAVKLQEGVQERKLILETHEKGEVHARHITSDAAVEILNPDLLMATITEDVSFEMEIGVKRGRGYTTAEEHYQSFENPEMGIIPVDSIFTPVNQVAYHVEPARVGKLTNYDRLILEIWTNGVISPEDALVEASKILRKHLNPFIQYQELNRELPLTEKLEAEAKKRQAFVEELRSKLGKPIGELDVSVRANHCLKMEKIKTVGDLVRKGDPELLKIRNFGRTTLREIKKKLQEMGLNLGMNIDAILQKLEDRSVPLGELQQLVVGPPRSEEEKEDVESEEEPGIQQKAEEPVKV